MITQRRLRMLDGTGNPLARIVAERTYPGKVDARNRK